MRQAGSLAGNPLCSSWDHARAHRGERACVDGYWHGCGREPAKLTPARAPHETMAETGQAIVTNGPGINVSERNCVEGREGGDGDSRDNGQRPALADIRIPLALQAWNQYHDHTALDSVSPVDIPVRKKRRSKRRKEREKGVLDPPQPAGFFAPGSLEHLPADARVSAPQPHAGQAKHALGSPPQTQHVQARAAPAPASSRQGEIAASGDAAERAAHGAGSLRQGTQDTHSAAQQGNSQVVASDNSDDGETGSDSGSHSGSDSDSDSDSDSYSDSDSSGHLPSSSECDPAVEPRVSAPSIPSTLTAAQTSPPRAGRGDVTGAGAGAGSGAGTGGGAGRGDGAAAAAAVVDTKPVIMNRTVRASSNGSASSRVRRRTTFGKPRRRSSSGIKIRCRVFCGVLPSTAAVCPRFDGAHRTILAADRAYDAVVTKTTTVEALAHQVRSCVRLRMRLRVPAVPVASVRSVGVVAARLGWCGLFACDFYPLMHPPSVLRCFLMP